MKMTLQRGSRTSRSFAVLGAAVLALMPLSGGAAAPSTSPAQIELWRLDCGEFPDFPLDEMSDAFDYPGQKKTLTDSCYLVRHNDDFMLWDTGFRPSLLNPNGKARHQTIVQQLARIGLAPEKITLIGISHFHFDHTGQASLFPGARLLIGQPDFELLAHGVEAGETDDIRPWLADTAKVDRVVGDKDVFADGTVIMLATPGHTPGHHSLLVRLAKRGNVILSGDLWHFAEQISHNGVPLETMDRAAELASMDRITRATANLHALLIIQHEAADIDKLPQFPLSAK
jgi:N-acyl homoserine lactone hydrolase